MRKTLATVFPFLLLIFSLSQSWAQTVPARNINDITALLDQYKPDPKLAEQNRAKAYAEPPANLSGRDLAKFIYARAWAAQAIGDSRREIADLRNAVELIEGGGESQQQYQQGLSNALMGAGNLLEGIRIRETLSQKTSPGRLLTLNSPLVTIYQNLGDENAARIALRRAESGYSRSASFTTPLAIAFAHERDYFIYRARAGVVELEGKYDQAEVGYRRALRAAEINMEQAEDRIATRNISEGQTPESHREIAAYQLDLAQLGLSGFLIRRNRLEEAELMVRNLLQRCLVRLGRDNVRTARVMVQFANILRVQGRYHEALQMAQASVGAYERAGAVQAASGLASARRTLAAVLVSQARWVEAVAAYEEMRAGLAQEPENLAALGKGDSSWGLALVKTGRAAEAISLLGSGLAQERRVLGESHPVVALSRGVLGMALARTGDKQRALDEFHAATTVLLESGLAAERSAVRIFIVRHILESYIELLLDIRGTDLERALNVDATAQAFVLADRIRGQGVQRALAASAARAASGDPAIADLMRKEQDFSEQIRALYTYLFNQLSLPPAEQSPKVTGDMRSRLEEIGVERKKLQADLQKQFPRYADFVNPRPVTLEQARSALRRGEVLLSMLVTEDRAYVWAVGAKGSAFSASKLGSGELRRMVTVLRKALDPGDVQLGTLPELDLATAYRLYAELLKPTEELWRDATTLLVVANGSLAEIPLVILPTAPVMLEKKAGLQFEGYRTVPWLARKFAVVQLPSVNSLLTLRALPAGNASRSAFLGFGDPQFDRKQVAAATGASSSVQLRNLSIPRTEEGGKAVEWIEYSQLARLPDTRDEILAIAAALKADPRKDVYLGREASKHRLKSLDLKNRRVIAFATHGLVPGDFPNLTEPALALAAPDDERESGLLTLEDILTLKLDADWVVLSACNTAAGDGAGAEAVSGLGRGFFYAGSRSLLVTHWPVETRSARMLVTGIFERYTNDAKITRAEALRQSMLSLMDTNYADPATQKPIFSYAHPIFWAPYAIVGDGGAH